MYLYHVLFIAIIYHGIISKKKTVRPTERAVRVPTTDERRRCWVTTVDRGRRGRASESVVIVVFLRSCSEDAQHNACGGQPLHAMLDLFFSIPAARLPQPCTLAQLVNLDACVACHL
jgi:hypothetical protein